jgi:hypothetical protein
MQFYLKISFCLLLAIICFSCQQKPGKVNRAFYYWKSNFSLDSTDVRTLQDLRINKLYIKFFDVDLDSKNEPVPVAPVAFNSPVPGFTELIPVVFITNQTIKKLSHEELEKLAEKIFNKIQNQLPEELKGKISEYQLDCDWSESTRHKYFKFLQKFKSLDNKAVLSVTLRLHQVKHFDKTGVPPADRGLLMYYNMDDVKKFNIQNSILNNKLAAEYLKNLKPYPMPIDLGFPVFSWTAVFRNQKFVSLLYSSGNSHITKSNHTFKTRDNFYVNREDTVIQNLYLRSGDYIRNEQVSAGEIFKGSRMCLKLVKQQENTTIALFHFNMNDINYYGNETIHKIYSVFE